MEARTPLFYPTYGLVVFFFFNQGVSINMVAMVIWSVIGLVELSRKLMTGAIFEVKYRKLLHSL